MHANWIEVSSRPTRTSVVLPVGFVAGVFCAFASLCAAFSWIWGIR